MTPERIIDSNTAAIREKLVIASLLDSPDAKPGPNISTALAHAPTWWEDPVSGRLAEAIRVCGVLGRPHTSPLVAEHLIKADRQWLFHPSFNPANALPIEIAEVEALDLLVSYRGKRLAAAVNDAYDKITTHPEKARELARALINTLKEFV